MTGTGTYANKQLTPSQTELISFLGQLEASSSCWEEEESFRITIKNLKKREKRRARQLWEGCGGLPRFSTDVLHPAMPACHRTASRSIHPCHRGLACAVVPVTDTSWGWWAPASPQQQGHQSCSKVPQLCKAAAHRELLSPRLLLSPYLFPPALCWAAPVRSINEKQIILLWCYRGFPPTSQEASYLAWLGCW